jgi:hypothetical protein
MAMQPGLFRNVQDRDYSGTWRSPRWACPCRMRFGAPENGVKARFITSTDARRDDM